MTPRGALGDAAFWISDSGASGYLLERCYTYVMATREYHAGRSPSLRKTSVVIDEGLLAEAQKALRTTTVRDTIEGALLEVIRVRARRREIDALAGMKGMDLADPEVMGGAWRR